MEKKPRTTEPSKQSQRRISRQMNKHWILLSIGSINSGLRDPIMTHLNTDERETVRKARGLQMEEIACKCQTFFSLKRQEETN